jgi:hypothetical protein
MKKSIVPVTQIAHSIHFLRNQKVLLDFDLGKFLELEKRVVQHDGEIAAIIDAIRQLMAPKKKSEREIGFHVRESPPRSGARKRR